MAAESANIFLEDIPIEINFEIWLQLPYELAKVVCEVGKRSTDSRAAVLQRICDDPLLWQIRARRLLGVDATLFQNRSIIERTLTLPESKARWRYVELVSRQGAVDDSIYFISAKEIVRRAIRENNRELTDRYIPLLKPGDLGEIVTNLNRDIHFRRPHWLDSKGRANDLIGIISSRNKWRDALTQGDVYYMGLIAEPPEDYFTTNYAEIYLTGLIVGGHLDEADVFIRDYGNREVYPNIFPSAILAALYIVGRDDLFLRYQSHISGHYLEFYRRSSDVEIARTPNPGLYITQLAPMIGQKSFRQVEEIITIMIGDGYFDNLNVLIGMLKDRFGYDAMGYVTKQMWYLMGRNGLQFFEWLINAGIRAEDVRKTFHITFEKYLWTRYLKEENFVYKSVLRFLE